MFTEEQDYENFLGVDLSQKDKDSTKPTARCKRKLAQLEDKGPEDYIDSGYNDCNWFSEGLLINCKNNKVVGLNLKLRNLSSEVTIMSPPVNLNGDLPQWLLFPLRKQNNLISLLYKKDSSHQYLIGIDISFGNQLKSLNCDQSGNKNQQFYEETELRTGEVISGITYSTKKDSITNLQFYTNRLIPDKPIKKSKSKSELFYDIYKTH